MTNRRGIVAVCALAVLVGLIAMLGPAFDGPLVDGSTSTVSSTAGSAVPPSPAPGLSQHAAPRPLAVLTRAVAQAGPNFLTQRFTGIVVARRTTRLAAKALGRVERVSVDIGDEIQAGQLLIELDRDQLENERGVVRANLQSAEAGMTELENGPREQEVSQGEARVQELKSLVELQQAQLGRSESLRNSAAISAQELDENRFRTDAVVAQLRSAELSLELLREGTRAEQLAAQRAKVAALNSQLSSLDIQLAEKRITAPYAGHIQARLADEGQIVTAGEPLLVIVETGVLEVRVGVPVELTEHLNQDALQVTWQQQTLAAKLARLSPTVDSNTRTREVVLALDAEAHRRLAIGTAVEVALQTPLETQGFWIPHTALTAGERGLWAVFVAVPVDTPATAANSVLPYRIERRQVELLRSQGEWSEVRGPLSATEQLVVDGNHRVVNDQLVTLQAD